MEHSKKYILAIDLGTSGPKVALVSVDCEILASDFEETPVKLLPNGGAEQDPQHWWSAIVKATRRLLGKQLVSNHNIVAIAGTAQWSGTVAVDRTGQAIANAIIWMDSRGKDLVRDLSGGFPSIAGYGLNKLRTWISLTGGIPGHSGKDPIAHILYLKEEFPEIYNAAYKFLEPKDYINLRLTGEFISTYDAITLHWLTDNRDIKNICYSDKLIRLTGIDRDKLPDLTHATDIIGTLTPQAANELGLTTKVQVVAGTPDVQSAAIGSGAVNNFDGHLYIGTSSWLTCHVPYKKSDLLHNMASLPSAIPDRYFVANTQESAGACLNFLKNNIFYKDDGLSQQNAPENIYKIFDRIAAKIPAGSGRLIFTPWLYGERTPVEDAKIRGGFYNMSLNSTRGDLIRAVYEGVAYNSRWLLKYVERFIKQRFEKINMIGGGANSNIWCQIHADILKRPIHQVADPIQANIRGAAWLAIVALGYGSFSDVAGKTNIANVFDPDSKNRELYDRLFQTYLEIYKANKKIHARLN